MRLKTPHALLRHYRQQQYQGESSFLTQDNAFSIITRKKIKTRLLGDLYHSCLTMGWLPFFAVMTCIYLLINLVFGGCYFFVPHGLNHVRDGDFWAHFFFSVQTLSTVGYGYTYPQTYMANALVSLEVLVGVLFTALITGLVFARFARPHARVMFSRVATLSHEGDHARLNFRVGNLRSTPLINVSIEAILARAQKDAGGNSSLQLDILPLTHSHIPLFPVSLSFTHPITEKSPLYGKDQQSLLHHQAEIILTLTATDPVSAQSVFSYHTYNARDVLYGSRFVSLLKPLGNGTLEVDFSLFHTTTAESLPDEDEDHAHRSGQEASGMGG